MLRILIATCLIFPSIILVLLVVWIIGVALGEYSWR